MRKILCYGDSNTYGFDPRAFSGGRYSEDKIWTARLEEALAGSCIVINEGMNGRRLPSGEHSLSGIGRLLSKMATDDLFAVMLGTNDLLVSVEPDSAAPVRRMENMLKWLAEQTGIPRIFIIAPPHIASPDHPDPLMKKYYRESVRMNEGFCRLAKKYNVLFADSAEWNVGLAYDGVHFTEEGHRTFAENLLQFI